MLKRLFAISIAALLFISIAGCAPEASDPTEGQTNPPVTENSTEATENQGIQVDENLLTVEITLPASFFEGEEIDMDAYAQEQGFISAYKNEDGSVTAKMTRKKYNELLEETRESLETTFASFISDDTPYIKEVTHNDDFTEVAIYVNRTEYESAFDITPFAVGIAVGLYQQVAQIEYHVEVSIVDADTGDLINSITYPDAFNN